MTGYHELFRRPPGIEVTYRRMRFPFEDTGFDRYWHGGSAFRSLFWSQLSTSFDAGERFFIDSARALRNTIGDPALHAELAEFCKQEGHHTQQHLKFDRANSLMGLDIEGCRRRYNRVIARARRRLSPMGMLAVTVALEHFTASLADVHFERGNLSEGADPNVQALWDWHSAEETEHKATCYDIYRGAGGGYVRRVVMLPVSWGLILFVSLLNTAVLLHKDGRLWTRDTLRGLGYLFGARGIVTALWPAFFAYFRPRFHPWHHDNSGQIAAWSGKNQAYVAVDPAHSPRSNRDLATNG
jgi:predicted metal-dependent hydrolase